MRKIYFKSFFTHRRAAATTFNYIFYEIHDKYKITFDCHRFVNSENKYILQQLSFKFREQISIKKFFFFFFTTRDAYCRSPSSTANEINPYQLILNVFERPFSLFQLEGYQLVFTSSKYTILAETEEQKMLKNMRGIPP